MSDAMSLIQYAFACDEDGVLTPIHFAKRNARYTCPNCKSPLTPVMGKTRTSHFRHTTECCALESYLHVCAKRAFFQMYQAAVDHAKPVSLALKRNVCCIDPRLSLLNARDSTNACKNENLCTTAELARYDLTRFFNHAQVEKQDTLSGFTPDVLLTSTDNLRRCFVEIHVTHACSPEKIDTGVPILEFFIRNPEDIQYLLDGVFSVLDDPLTVYNWTPPVKAQAQCSGECPINSVSMDVWQYSASGRLQRKTMPLSAVDLSIGNRLNTWETSLPQSVLIERLRTFLANIDPRGDFPNCVRCQHAKDWESGYLYCRSKSKKVTYTEARQCASYQEFTCQNS